MITAHILVRKLCEMGLTGVTVEYDKESDQLYYDLNTGAESGLRLYEDLHVSGRYDYINEQYREDEELECVLRALYWMFDSCLCGRDYCNSSWKEIGVQLGILEKVVETHTTVTYK